MTASSALHRGVLVLIALLASMGPSLESAFAEGAWRSALRPLASPPLPPERPADLSLPGQAAVLDFSPPLPPQRPADLASPRRIAVLAPATPAPNADQQCAVLESSGEVVGNVIAPIVGAGPCGIASPIRISEIRLRNGGSVDVRPPAVIRCSLARVLATWVRDDLAPAVGRAGQKLTGIDEAGSYQCRSRDHVAGAKISEHAKGDALDIRALDLQQGPFFVVAQNPQNSLARDFRDSACQRFATVLGPGADAYHADNVHLDLETRRHSGHLCQWRLP